MLFCLPPSPSLQRFIIMFSVETKKDVGETVRRLSHYQAFALPPIRISNLVSPRHLRIIMRYAANGKLYKYSLPLAYGYNTPYVDASLRYLLIGTKGAKFDSRR